MIGKNYYIRTNSQYKSLIWCSLFIFLVFYDSITKHIPIGSYLDELIAIAIFSWILIARKRVKINSEETKIFLCIIGIVSTGLLSGIIYKYVTNINIIFRDIVGTFKFFLAFVGFDYVFGKNNKNISKNIIKIAKFLITVIFLFGVASLFFDLGMGDIVRHGIRSYKFIFEYYNILVLAEVIFIATLMCDTKRNNAYYLMAIITAALTLRTKSIAVIILTIAFKLLETKKNNPVTYGKITKSLKYVLPITVVIVFAVRDKLLEYLSWGKYSSIRIGALVEGWDIFRDHFPLGTGFGTYGTNLSYNTGSIIYQIYGRVNYSMMMDSNYGFAAMSDTYWPSIYAQFGIIGTLLFIYCIVQCLIRIRNYSYVPDRNKQAAIYIFIYMLIASFSEASFTNSSGVVSAMMMMLLLNMSGKDIRNKIPKKREN